jgi:membrane protease YdiL (CAAX protease family)
MRRNWRPVGDGEGFMRGSRRRCGTSTVTHFIANAAGGRHDTAMRPRPKKRTPPKTQVKRPTPKPRELSGKYWDMTHRPLQCLVFLLPIIVAYEAGMAIAHGNEPLDARPRLAAQQLIYWAFSLIGVPDVYFYLPGFVLVGTLLLWHLVKRYPWKVSWPTVAGMAGASVLLAGGFLLLYRVVPPMPVKQAAAALVSGGGAAMPLQAGLAAHDLSALDNLLLDIGAGLYEELVFRLVLVSALWTLFHKVIRWREVTSVALAVVISSLLFAAHHFESFGGQDPWSTPRFAFFAACGAYLAAVFVARGFGLAVGCHAFYNVATLLIGH